VPVGGTALYAATCRGRVIAEGWELEGLLKRLQLLTHSPSPDDFAVWEGERLVAAVFSSGQAVVFQQVASRSAAPLWSALSALRANEPALARDHLRRAGLIGKPTGTVRLLLLAVNLAEQGLLGSVPSLLDAIAERLPTLPQDHNGEGR
jgi:hypothetical protein